MERRAVVLEVGSDTATVLVEGGEVRRLPIGRNSLVVGQEIWIPAETRWRWQPWAAAAALLLLVVGGGLWHEGRSIASAVGVISVDINPSIDIGFGGDGQVVSVAPMDRDAKILLAEMPALQGMAVPQAVLDIVGAARQHGYLKTSPIVMLAAGASDPRAASAAQSVLKDARQALLRLKTLPAQVVMLPLATSASINAAARDHLSLGRYEIWRHTQMPEDAVRADSIQTLLKHWPLPATHQDHGHHAKKRRGSRSGSGSPAGEPPHGTTPVPPGAVPSGTTPSEGKRSGILPPVSPHNSGNGSGSGTERHGSPNQSTGHLHANQDQRHATKSRNVGSLGFSTFPLAPSRPDPLWPERPSGGRLAGFH